MTIIKLKRLKKKTGLSNKMLAERLGVAERTLYSWLSGERKIKPWTVKLIDMMLASKQTIS